MSMTGPQLGHTASLSNSATRWFGLNGWYFSNLGTSFAMAAQPMTGAGVIQNAYFLLTTAPGAGTNYTFTLYLNNVATSMVVTIADAATTGNYTATTVSYNDGDLVAWQCVPTGTPAASAPLYSAENVQDGYPILGGDPSSPSAAATSYSEMQSVGFTTTAPTLGSIIPAAGTISKLQLASASAPGAGKSWTATLVLNGVDQALSAQISGASAVLASDPSNSVTVAAGDEVYWKLVPAGTPTASAIHPTALFTPTTNGESIQMYSSHASTIVPGAISYVGTGGSAIGGGASTVENNRIDLISGAYDLKKLYAKVGTAPGAAASGKIDRFVVRANNASTTVTCDILETATTANDTTHTGTITAGQRIGVGLTGVSTPATTVWAWGYVTYQAGSTAYSQNLSDTETPTDANAKAVGSVCSDSDTPTDSPSKTAAYVRTSSDSTTEADALIKAMTKNVTGILGDTAIEAGTYSTSADRKTVSPFTATENGIAERLVARVWVTIESTTAKAIIHADSAGAPGALLATSDEVTVTNAATLPINFPFSGANRITLTSGTTYWIGVHSKDPGTGNFRMNQGNTASQSATATDTYSDGPSNPFGAPTVQSGPNSCWVEYSDATAEADTISTKALGKALSDIFYSYDGINLITNPDFETGSGTTNANFSVSGWQISIPASGSVISVSSTNQYSGSQCIKIVVDGSNSNNGLQQSIAMFVLPLTTYTISAWVKSDTAGQLQLQIRDGSLITSGNYLQSDGVTWNSTPNYANVSTTTSYTRYTQTFTTAAGQTRAYIADFKRSGVSSQAGRTFYIDDLHMHTNSPTLVAAYIRSFTDTLTITDNNSNNIYKLLALADSITATDTFSYNIFQVVVQLITAILSSDSNAMTLNSDDKGVILESDDKDQTLENEVL